MCMAEKVKVGKYLIELSSQDKILFPKSKITKGTIITYYSDIASTMIPYMKGRLISMQRFPDGIMYEGFYQKDASDYFPQWIDRVNVKKKDDGSVAYVVVNSAATLVYLANQACITPHIWLSRSDKLNTPDRMIFDLDPSGKADFTDVQWAADILYTFLRDDLGLPVFVMTTGSRGAHVVVPLKRLQDFEYVRAFAYDVATVLIARYPKRLTVEMQKKNRKNKIFIDWLRNAYGATGVAPYALRALEGAPVAMPLEWEEFSKIKSAQAYTIENVVAHVRRYGDAWKNIHKYATGLTDARKILNNIMKKENI